MLVEGFGSNTNVPGARSTAPVGGERQTAPRSLRWLGLFLLLDLIVVIAIGLIAWSIAPVLVLAVIVVTAAGVVAVTWALGPRPETRRSLASMLGFKSGVTSNAKGNEVPDSV